MPGSIKCPDCGAYNLPGKDKCWQCGQLLPVAEDDVVRIEPSEETPARPASYNTVVLVMAILVSAYVICVVCELVHVFKVHW